MNLFEKISNAYDSFGEFRFRVIYTFLKIIWLPTLLWGLYDGYRWLRQTPAERIINPDIEENAATRLIGGVILLLLWLLYRWADRRSAAKSKLP